MHCLDSQLIVAAGAAGRQDCLTNLLRLAADNPD